MRLYDRVVINGVVYAGFTEWETIPPHQMLTSEHFAGIAGATNVDIQNVYDYLVSVKASGNDDIPLLEMRLPWPRIWFEYTALSETGLTARVGVLAEAHISDNPEIAESQTWTFFVQSVDSDAVFIGKLHPDVQRDGAMRGADGTVGPSRANPIRLTTMPFAPGEVDREPSTAFIQLAFATARLALMFAHCKNVSVQEHHTPPKVAAKRRKAGKPPGTSYKTLLIDPMKETLRTEGNIEKNGLKKALHICRGHFATYTEDKPLFGKVTGTFWKPMHVRGNKKHGEIKKDYVIGAPD